MIESLRDSIRRDLFYAQASRDFWWRCIGANERREETLLAMNSHLGYFGIAVQQFYESYLIAMSRLYDSNERSVSLRSLFRELKQATTRNDLDEVAIEQLMQEAEVIAKGLKLIRNKHVAHLSAEVFATDFYKIAGLTYDQIRGVWDLSWEAFSSLSYALDGTSESVLQDNVEAFDLLIDGLATR